MKKKTYKYLKAYTVGEASQFYIEYIIKDFVSLINRKINLKLKACK